MNSKSECFYGRPATSSTFASVLSILAAHESLHSAKTSTLPLAQFWCDVESKAKVGKSLSQRIDEFWSAAGEDVPPLNASYCFEYAVPVNGGKGKASMTDLMVISDKLAIAIEAKYTECIEKYETIAKWLGRGDNRKNRLEVLNGWWKYIQNIGCTELNRNLHEDEYEVIPYQLLHRIASACSAAADNPPGGKPREPVVVYHMFYDEESKAVGKKACITSRSVTDFVKGILRPAVDIMRLKNIRFFCVMTKVRLHEGIPISDKEYDYGELFAKMLNGEQVYGFYETKPCDGL